MSLSIFSCGVLRLCLFSFSTYYLASVFCGVCALGEYIIITVFCGVLFVFPGFDCVF